MEIPAPTAVASPMRKTVCGVVRREGRGEDGGERGDRAVHEAREAGLDDAQDEVLIVGDDAC